MYQLHQGIGGSGHFVVVGPGQKLEHGHHLGLGFDACHQFGERGHLLMHTIAPAVDLWWMIVTDLLHREYQSISSGRVGFARPERWEGLNDQGYWLDWL